MIDYSRLFAELEKLIDKPHEYNRLISQIIYQIHQGSVTWEGGVAYGYDPQRQKYLSIGRNIITAGSYGLNQEHRSLKIEGVTTAGGAGFLMPRKATLTGIWAKSRSPGQWQIELRKNNLPMVIASHPVVGGFGSEMGLDIDLTPGDTLEVYLNGSGVDHPIAGFEFAWRADINQGADT